MGTPPRLRVVFVCDTLHDSVGGGVTSAGYVIERLQRDHHVTSLSADGEHALPALRLPVRALREMRFVLARPDRAVIRQALELADVVHLQMPFWLSFATLAEARRLGLPVVAGFHVQPENGLHNVGIYWPWLNELAYRFVVAQFFNKVDAVVCPTAFAEQKLRAHGLTTEAVVVSNGVPPDVARAAAHAAPRVARRDDEPFFVLVVGRLAVEKRQELVIEAVRLSRHRDRIRLVISGRGPCEDALKRRARALPNGAEIRFLPRAELLAELFRADLFVHASEVELEGMAILEAMSAGLPPLIADAPESAASSFAPSDDFRFPAGDPLALRRKLDALIEDPAKLEAAREPCRRRARELDFEASVQKLVDVWRRAVERHEPPSRSRGRSGRSVTADLREVRRQE